MFWHWAAIFIGANSAGAVTVLFDDLTPGQNIEGQHFGDAWPFGVTISSVDGLSTHVVGPGNYQGVGYWSPFNAITNQGFMAGGNALVLTFDVPRGYVHFRVGDQGGDVDQVLVKAYDVNDNLIATWDSGLFGGNALSSGTMVDYWNFTRYLNYMKTVTIESIGPEAGVGLDDLVFCHPVPVPPTLLLLGAGLIGLIPLRKRLGK